MNNRQSLKEYLSQFRSLDEKRRVYFIISNYMHKIHNDGQFFPVLSFKNIGVSYTNVADIFISGREKIGLCTMEEALSLKSRNILMLAQLMVCSYIDYDFDNLIICMEVLERDLDKLSSYFNSNDFDYLKKVIVNKEFLYYDDYMVQINDHVFSSLMKDDGLSFVGEEAFVNTFLLIINLSVVLETILMMAFILLRH